MGRKTSCSSKHGNPGRPKGHRYNQNARDSARMRGHEARDEIALVRKRAVKLSGLHGSINALVRKSNILTAANQRTTHMNVDEFCAYAEELLDRLFRLEQQIVQNTKRDFWRNDEDLAIISRALTLEKRAKELDGEFNLRRTGIHFTYPSASGHFALNDKGVSACAKIILCCEKDELRRQEQIHKLVDSGECDSYKTAEQRVCQATDEDIFQNLSKRSPLLPSEKESSWPKKSSR